MRRLQAYRALILSGGVTLYAVAMWLAWFDDRITLGPPPWPNYEMASVVCLLAGISLILLGMIVQGSTLTRARRALGGAAMILTAIGLVQLWEHGIYILAPNPHGWSFGFYFLPLVLLAGGGAWLLMALGGAVLRYLERRAGA